MKKRLYLCTRKKDEGDKWSQKKYLKKYLVEWKKGYTFAPAKRATKFIKKYW